MEKYDTQIKITLSFYGDYFIPDELTQYINISPTDFWIKGDIIPIRKGLTRKKNVVRVRKESAWEYSTEFIQTFFFEEASKIIEDVFQKKLSKIDKYMKEHRLASKIDIVVEIVDNQIPALVFNHDFIEFAHKLKADIDVDMHLLSNE